MKLIVILLLSIMLASTQRTYPPGVNFMMKNIIIDKFREIIIPDIMEKFKVIKPADIDHSSSFYEIRIYDMEADIIPLGPDQVTITMNEQDNTLFTRVTDFEMDFHASAYGRALFIHAHGDARIHAKVDAFEFKIEPKLKVDGDLNDLDYQIDEIKVDLSRGDIHLEHLSIGFLPSWLLTPIGNLILDSCTAAYSLFESQIDGLILEILNSHRADIPDHIDFPAYPISMSLSFPNVPRLYQDRVEVPFDGTIYLTSEGYHPQDDPAPDMPAFNPDNQNNVQVFLNQHVLKTTFDAARKAPLTMDINADTLAPFNLPDDIMKVEYMSMIFPRLACHYDGTVPITIKLGVDPNLNTDVTFAPNKMHGEFSPFLEFHAGDDHAFTMSLRAIFEATVNFEVKDKQTRVTGSLDTIDFADFTFAAGTIEDSDLGEILDIFKATVVPMVITTANNILSEGVMIPVFTLIKDVFEIDLEDIELDLKDKYLEASFTLDIHERILLIKKLLGMTN
jgi:hypothetical protein